MTQINDNLSLSTRIDKELKNKSKLEENDVQNVLMNLIKRRRFKYTSSDILKYVFKCLCMRKIKKQTEKLKKHFIYDKGAEKLQEELNIITLLKTIRQVKLLTQVLLS